MRDDSEREGALQAWVELLGAGDVEIISHSKDLDVDDYREQFDRLDDDPESPGLADQS